MNKNPYLNQVIANISSKGNSIFSRFIHRGEELVVTWNALGRLSSFYCEQFCKLEISQGSVALIFLKHSTSLYGSFLGAMFAGITPSFVPCLSPKQDPKIYWKSHKTLFETIRPSVIVADQITIKEMMESGIEIDKIHLILALDDLSLANENQIALSLERSNFESIAFLQHSSGTTGLKKGVKLPYDSVLNQVVSYSESISLTCNDQIVTWLPLYHDMGLITGFIIPLYVGSPIIHMDPFAWVARPTILMDYITKYQTTFCWLPNFAFKHLANSITRSNASYDLSSMRAFINCSEVCTPEAFDEFYGACKNFNLDANSLQCCYAMAETVYAVTQTHLGATPKRISINPTNAKVGGYVIASDDSDGMKEVIEVGSAIKGCNICIYDNLNELEPGFAGEIGIKADFLFDAYNHQPELTSQKLKNNVYFTGDIGFIWHDSLYVLGREDDVVVINGRNIYSAEVEQILSSVVGLKPGRAIAIGRYYEQVGSMCLVIVAEKSQGFVSIEKVRREIIHLLHSSLNIAPKEIFFVEDGWLIKTTSGKISRKENVLKLDELMV